MTRFGQWWQRNRRAGHAYAEGAAMHGASPERHKIPQTRRAAVWGLGLPVAMVLAALVSVPLALLLLLLWPLQMLRLRLRGLPWAQAMFLTLGKLPEGQGVGDYWARRLRGRRSTLIEYK